MMTRIVLLLAFITCLLNDVKTQTKINRFGVAVITKTKDYRNSVMKDSLKQLVNVRKICSSVIIDLRYPSATNPSNYELLDLSFTSLKKIE